MKKLIFIVMMFFSFIYYVNAKADIVLTDLKVNNGQLAPKFDKYNNYYSITVNENISEIEFECTYDENKMDIEIANNHNIVNNELLYVTVFDRETLEQNSYIFKIYVEKEDIEVVNSLNDDNIVNLDKKEDNYNYAPIIGTVCFAIIIIVFKFMFL